MASLFISYSRRDIDFARRITEAFKNQKLDFWIDWEGIPPTVDWWKEIEKGIEEADVFLFLLSPDSVKSPVCKREIEHAVRNGKRLIPVVVRDVKAAEVPTELRSLNWIFIREQDEYKPGFEKLITAIHTDYGWVQIHRQLQVKALDWERNQKENSFLLRGKELQSAEGQLDLNRSKEPYPTGLQLEYVLVSRQTSNRQRRRLVVVLLIAAVIIAGLAYRPILNWLAPVYPDWEVVSTARELSSPPLHITMNLREPEEVYAAGQTAGTLFKSNNGGNTWTPIPIDGMNSRLLGLSALESNVYVLTEDAIWISHDKGGRWSPTGSLPLVRNDRLMSMTVNPFDEKEVYVSDNKGTIFHSADGGTTWDKDHVQRGYKGEQIRAMTTNGSTLILATEKGVWISTIGESQWSEITLAGCGDPSDTVSALGLQYPYSEPPEDGAFGIFMAIAGIGLCDSDSKGDNTLIMTQYTDITSLTLADQVDLFAYEGYIATYDKILRKRIWRYTDIEWWKIKTRSASSKGG